MLITADRIHNGTQWLPEGTVINLADDGTIIEVSDDNTVAGAKHYDGIICPGFVNAHCHLELSHMKGQIPEHTGLIPFLKQVALTRNNYTEEQKINARHQAFETMLANGVVAVGDIANTNDTNDLRAINKMLFHSFAEAIGFSENPQKQFEYAVSVYNGFAAQHNDMHRQSVVPHAPYSVSRQLFKLINEFNPSSVISVHNQECAAEDEYYTKKTGMVGDLLRTIGIDDGFFQPSGKSSLQTYAPLLASHPVIFIHNTYTTADDVAFAQAGDNDVHWCLCPNANLYIENRLPDIGMLVQHADNICIGTDSLSSNHQLSVLAELQTIKKHYPAIEWETLLKWATHNGAKALQMDNIVGIIEAGKKPGLLRISNIDTATAVHVL